MEQPLSKDATGKANASGREDETKRRSETRTRTSGNDTAASWDFIPYILYINTNAQTRNNRACHLPKSFSSILLFLYSRHEYIDAWFFISHIPVFERFLLFICRIK